MKARLIRSAAFVFGAITFFAPLLLAAPTRVVSRGTPVRAQSASTSAVSYSVEVPVVTRVVGTALFKTAIDISNNTANSVTVRYQYSYNRFTAAGGFFRSPIQTISLLPFDNFHSDDFVAFLGTIPGALEAGAADSSFGTLLVTFDGVPTSVGWEGTVFARTYSPNPTGVGTVAIAYPGSLFFESANQTLVATIRDTQLAPTEAGALRTNIGIRNTDVRGANQPVTVQLGFFDVTPEARPAVNGSDLLTISALRPGGPQLNNIRALAAIPANVTGMLVFADVVNPTAASPTIEGYVNILDGGTQDGAFFEMKCADTDGCG